MISSGFFGRPRPAHLFALKRPTPPDGPTAYGGAVNTLLRGDAAQTDLSHRPVHARWAQMREQNRQQIAGYARANGTRVRGYERRRPLRGP